MDTSANSHNITKILPVVAKGSILTLIGLSTGNILEFLSITIYARNYSTGDFGLFSFGKALLDILVIIGLLGLDQGVMRQISFYMSKNEKNTLNSNIAYSLIYSLIVGVLIFLLLFFLSDLIAIFFNNPSYSVPLKLISIAVPFYIIIFVLSGIFRGFKQVKEKAFFSDILRNILFIFLLIFVLFLNLSYIYSIFVFVLSIIITSNLFLYYFFKKRIISVKRNVESTEIRKELLKLSIPLFISTLMQHLITQINIFMLSYFKTSSEVGLYNIAHTIGIIVSMVLNSILFIYIPILSELFAQKNHEQIRRTYTTLTKWLCLFTFPIVITFISYPEIILTGLFGQKYRAAGIVLIITSIGYFMHVFMGPNGAVLTAAGETKFLMWSAILTAITNFGFNIVLIPFFDIIGAAISFLISIIFMNILKSIKIYKINKTSSFKKKIINPIFVSLVFMIIINLIIITLHIRIYLIFIPIIYIFFLFFFSLSLFLTKSITNEDIEMLLIIEKKFGFKLERIKKIFHKFYKL